MAMPESFKLISAGQVVNFLHVDIGLLAFCKKKIKGGRQ